MKRDPFFPSARYEVDRLFDTLVHTAWGSQAKESQWCPSVDVTETPDRYLLEMDLPGVHTSDSSITAEGRTLRVEGQRRRSQHSGERHHLVERKFGTFSRTFRLPEDADPERIRARLNEGVLMIEILKKERGGVK